MERVQEAHHVRAQAQQVLGVRRRQGARHARRLRRRAAVAVPVVAACAGKPAEGPISGVEVPPVQVVSLLLLMQET